MINFIVVDDENAIIDTVRNVITKVMFKTNLDYKIHTFNEYNDEFFEIHNSELENKIYILDIEVGKKSGLSAARIIRRTDWYSIILFLTAHYELEIVAYKSKILLYDFISKFDLYDKKIYDTISLCVENKLDDSKIILKTNRRIEQIKFANILYITYDSYIRKLKIVTKTREYETNESLKAIYKRLKGNFVYTHRACIVNINNVKTIDTKNKVITFVNGTKIDLLSRNHVKDIKELCKQ